jgi:hypothetical protein
MIDREFYSTFKCQTCRKPVGLNWRKGPRTHIRTIDNYFCSSECQQVALNSSGPYDPPPPYEYGKPLALFKDERHLMVGKSSGGMYFEPGRCVQCGQALGEPTAEFEFCSDSCRDKAARPFLDPQLLKSSVEDDRDYKEIKETLDDIRGCSSREYEAARKQLRSTLTQAEFIDRLERRLKVREVLFEQNIRERKNTALYHFQEQWVKQRQYILTQEREKYAQKMSKEEDKQASQRLKDAAENAKRLEKILEEEKWKPKKFEL